MFINNGNMKRDFTYIDDIVDGMLSVLHKPPKSNHFELTLSDAHLGF